MAVWKDECMVMDSWTGVFPDGIGVHAANGWMSDYLGLAKCREFFKSGPVSPTDLLMKIAEIHRRCDECGSTVTRKRIYSDGDFRKEKVLCSSKCRSKSSRRMAKLKKGD